MDNEPCKIILIICYQNCEAGTETTKVSIVESRPKIAATMVISPKLHCWNGGDYEAQLRRNGKVKLRD